MAITVAELEKLQAESNKLKAEYLEIAKSYDRTTETYKRIAATYAAANQKYLDAIANSQRTIELSKSTEGSAWNAAFFMVLGAAAIAICRGRRS